MLKTSRSKIVGLFRKVMRKISLVPQVQKISKDPCDLENGFSQQKTSKIQKLSETNQQF